jgi:hypothetical protein
MLCWRFGKMSVLLFLVLALVVSLPASALADAFSSSGTPGTGVSAPIPPDLTVKVNGQVVAQGVATVVYNGRMLIPLRDIIDGLGAQVDWLPDSQEAIITGGSHTITLKAGAGTAVIDGKETAMDTPARIIGGRILVPLRFLSESMGEKVIWVESTNTVEVLDPSRLSPDQALLLQAFENEDAMTGADMKRLLTIGDPGATDSQSGQFQTETDVKFDINGNDFHAWLAESVSGDDQETPATPPATVEIIKKDDQVYAKTGDDQSWQEVDEQFLDTVLYPLSLDSTPDEDFLDYYLLPFEVDNNVTVDGQVYTKFVFNLSPDFTADDQGAAPDGAISGGSGADESGNGTPEQATDDMYVDSQHRIVKQDLTLVSTLDDPSDPDDSGTGASTETFTLDMNSCYSGALPVIAVPPGVFPET